MMKDKVAERIAICIDGIGNRVDLSNLGLNEIPIEIQSIQGLQQINLSGNNIVEIPHFFFELTDLRVISLQKNKIRKIPNEIKKLQKLVRIELNDNKINEIGDGIGQIDSLTTIYLARNLLYKLPPSLANLKNLKVLSVIGNPLTIPVEILTGSIDALKNYLFSIGEGEVFNLCEAKLLIVGEGNVGKTEICNAILKKNNAGSTEGISISRWIISKTNKKYFINIWDFGGQEIYHATHQYFLTKKSLYLFVWNARTDDDLSGFDYWLNIVNLLTDSAPIVVVQNKCDERKKEIDTGHIKNQFKNVVTFINTSATSNIGIDDLKTIIVSEIEKLDHFNQIVPLAWIKIRELLENFSKPYMSFNEYIDICKNNGLDENKATWLSEYFHVLGIFLHFPDNIILENIIFLNPEWATKASYSIFDDNKVIEDRGLFSNKTLMRVWKDYPREKFPALLELMKKFELCFEINNSGQYIVPSRLPAIPPDSLKLINQELVFHYEYEFMPAGIIERAIVRLHPLIYKTSYWKNGVLINKDDTFALIRSDRFTRRISIILEGTSKSDLLTIVRNEIEYIHNSLNNPALKERIPCICDECLRENPYFFDYKIIQRARAKNKKTVECRKSFESIEISAILGGIDGTIESKENEMLKLLRGISDQYDNEDSLKQKANSILQLKPNVFGVGINLNYLIKKILNKQQNKTA